MRLTVIAVGRLKAGAERELAARYVDRVNAAGARIGLSVAIREIPESKAARPADRSRDEALAIAAALPDGVPVIALAETGDALTSEAFARKLGRWRDDGEAEIVFVIGGADGLDDLVLGHSRLRLAFGAMTWPHQLVRAMLAEQLYRAVTILSGHPYHRA
ncbi:MAG: 23S rRNA (pseudouridine(1915)-N(3))-methyltransferase RlmH [Bauldia sp.]|nr:23S rRNA (pseudouridine(1915)-N(3))-methyltransferase RlmH [Bauldia sp.]